MNYRHFLEEKHWSRFLDWLSEVSFDPRNGEHIDTIFWWWIINVQFPAEDEKRAKEVEREGSNPTPTSEPPAAEGAGTSQEGL
jgi:hypothetical protein